MSTNKLPTPAQSIQSEVTGNFLIWNSHPNNNQNSLQRRPVTTKQITTLPPILVPSLAQHLLNLTTLNTLINLFTQNQLIPPEELLIKSQSLHKSIYEPWQNSIQTFLRARRQYIKSRANNLPPDKSLRAFVLPFSDPDQIQNRLTQIKEIALNQAKAQFQQSFKNLSLLPNHSSPSPDTAAPTTTTTTTTATAPSHTDPQSSSHCDETQSNQTTKSIQSSSSQDVPNNHNHASVASELISSQTQSFPLSKPDEPLRNTGTLHADPHHSSHQDVSQSDPTTESSSHQRVPNEDTRVAECSKTSSSQVQTLPPVPTGHPDQPFHNTVVGSAITPADQNEYVSFSSFNPTPIPSTQQCTQSPSSYPATQPIPCKASTPQHFSSPQSVHYHQVQPTPPQLDHTRRPLPQSGRVVVNQDQQTFTLVSQPQTYSRSNVLLQSAVHHGQSAPQNILRTVGPSSGLVNTTPSTLPSTPPTRGPVIMTELQLQAYHANEKVEAERMYLRGLHQLNHQFSIFMMQEGLVDPVKGSQAIKIREQELIKRKNHFNNFMLTLAHKQQGQLHAMREMRHRVSHVIQTQCMSAMSSIPGYPLVAPSHGINAQYGPNLVSSSTPTNPLRSVPTNTIGSLGNSHQIENRSAVTLNHSNSLPLHNPSTQLFSSPTAPILNQVNLSSPTRTDPQACLSSPTVTHASVSSPVQISHSIQLHPHHPNGITNDESNNNAKDDQNKESNLMMKVGKRKRANSYPIGRSNLDEVKQVEQVIAQTNTSDEVMNNNQYGKKTKDVDLTTCDPPLKKAKLGQLSRIDNQLDNNNNNTLACAPSHIPTPVTRSTQTDLIPESSNPHLENSTLLLLQDLSPDYSTSMSSGLDNRGLVKNPSASSFKNNLDDNEEDQQVHRLNNMVRNCQHVLFQQSSYKLRRSRSPSSSSSSLSSSSSSSSTSPECEAGNNGKKKKKKKKKKKRKVDDMKDMNNMMIIKVLDDRIPSKNHLIITPPSSIELKMTSSSSLLFSSSSSSSSGVLLSKRPSSSSSLTKGSDDDDDDEDLFINLDFPKLKNNHHHVDDAFNCHAFFDVDDVDNWFTLSL